MLEVFGRYRFCSLLIGVLLVVCMPSLIRQVCRAFTMAAQQTTGTTPFSIAYVTAPSMDVAKDIARHLVEQKLVACVNIIPSVVSVFEWEKKIEEESEVLMMLKTRSSKMAAVSKAVSEKHPYDVPEVIVSPITHGHEPYLKWVGETVPE